MFFPDIRLDDFPEYVVSDRIVSEIKRFDSRRRSLLKDSGGVFELGNIDADEVKHKNLRFYKVNMQSAYRYPRGSWQFIRADGPSN